mgnify:CR=1 FL=1
MTAFDYIVLAVIGLSVFFSLMRGMVREVLSLAGWVLAFFQFIREKKAKKAVNKKVNCWSSENPSNNRG